MKGPVGHPLRSWLVDAAIVGLGVGALFPFALFGTVAALEGGPTNGDFLGEFAQLMAASLVASVVVSVSSAVPAAWLVRVCWPRTPLGGLALGPVIGAVAAISLLLGISVILQPHRSVDLRPLVWVGLAGALGVGPPWVAYLAVLARGRSGRGVALATPVWAMGAVVVALLALWVRWKLGYGR